MTGWWAPLAVVAAAVLLMVVKELVDGYEAAWVANVAAHVDTAGRPAGDSDADADVDAETDWQSVGVVPDVVRAFCPPPPFTALVYHHTCGSCRALWAEAVQDPELADVHLVHDADKLALLNRQGVHRQPAIALPAEVMESLPSGLALRVERDWHLGDVQLVATAAELRALHRAAVDGGRVGAP